MFLRKLFEAIVRRYEPEHSEIVDHDTVLVIASDGTVCDFTEGDDE